MKYLILTLVATVMTITAVSAQQTTVSYAYDDNGNRISRVINLLKDAATPNNDPSQELAPELSNMEDKALTDKFDKAIINIYPNPTSSSITIAMEDITEQPIQIRIVSTNGALIYEGLLRHTQQHKIDMSPYASGNYHLILSRQDKSINWLIIKN